MMLYQLALAVMDSRLNTLLICLDRVRTVLGTVKLLDGYQTIWGVNQNNFAAILEI